MNGIRYKYAILLFNVQYLYCLKTRNKNDKNGANQKNIEWLRMSIKINLLKKSCGKKIHDLIFFG